MAATFEIAPGAGLTELSTRVRVNAYTDIHAVAEAADGTLYVTKQFVKAAGGCAAPAAKDPEVAARQMGQMKLRQFAAADGSAESARHEAQLMIRHPNNSGLQKDQVTLLYIPTPRAMSSSRPSPPASPDRGMTPAPGVPVLPDRQPNL